MEKIPVGATIARAYNFAFGQFFTILGRMWLPWVLLIAASFFLARIGASARSGQTAASSFVLLGLPLYAVMFIFVSMIFVGLIEQALDRWQGSGFFYVNLGKPVWLLLGAYLILFVITVGLMVGLVLVMTFASTALPAAGAGLLGRILIDLAALCAVVYVLVRASFLVTPVAAIERRVGLGRAWTLAGGNFWRIFVVLLAVSIPALIAYGLVLAALVLPGMPSLPTPASSPGGGQAAQAAIQAWQAAMTSRTTDMWYIYYPVVLVFSVVFYSLIAGAQAFAYSSVAPGENLAEHFS